jgi:hypothetical protein
VPELRSVLLAGQLEHRSVLVIVQAKANVRMEPVRRHITGDYGPLMAQPETALSHSSWMM